MRGERRKKLLLFWAQLEKVQMSPIRACVREAPRLARAILSPPQPPSSPSSSLPPPPNHFPSISLPSTCVLPPEKSSIAPTKATIQGGVGRCFFDVLHLCCGMEEASGSMEGASGSHAPSISRASSEEGDFFDSHHPESDQEDDGPSTGGYTASEIAGRFIKAIDGKARVVVDTAAPIDSVRGAAGKFGGILDWRERRQQAQEELGKVAGEKAEYQRRSAAAEAGRADARRDLAGATGEIDDLWLSVKRAQIAEAQARKDADLAKLRLRKTEKRAAARAELAGLRERHTAARAELGEVRKEMGAVRRERDAVAAEAGAAAARARETAGEAVAAGEAVREAAEELVAVKTELESARAAHDVAEEKRLRLAMAWQEDKVRWQNELDEGEEEARRLRDELVAAGELETKVAAASEQLANLRAELFACAVEGASAEETAAVGAPSAKLASARKELEEVKTSVEKAQDEAKILRVAAASLRADLEKEKAELAAVRRKEEATSASIPPLEEELNRVTSELTVAQARARESEKSRKPEQLSEARREAERAKASAQAAQEEIAVAREEARVAKAAVQTMEARLEAVMREILAANASAETATASAEALMQQQQDNKSGAVEGGVALAAEEYEELSRRARETEEVAGKRVVEAVKLIKEAKDAEVRSLENLSQLTKQTEQRRQALQAATAEAEEAELCKAEAERELRQLQAEHRRAGGETASPRTGLAEISAFDGSHGRGNPHILSPRGGYMPRADMAAMSAAEEADAKQKKNFFPRMAMFLARKKAQNWNGK
ncbi:protein WEAK CHLOROPLAST MOVEMENT UNDER BLUE LIGHT 1-like [Lolium rigidum]|uniref:protein WEAK CHLOROPLAST MOVEMENT UNDER BLUE LIGHT 1-like n=1 Tax=Lolium rigidum TaxID=89674 RepID=UPI001F5CC275|nr:protein WEAK CHLOROPLAST MOVEMENT UNDER BLUE LIGHT 1-like [Lolium rigidum]